MHLLSSGPSPYARKCRAIIAQLGISDIEIRDVTANPLGGDAALNSANPLGKVPALIRPSAQTLYDSRVITQFLNQHAGATLYRVNDWDILTLEALADGILDAAVGMVYEDRMRSPHGLVWQDWLNAQWTKIARSLDHLEQETDRLDSPLHAGHIALGCALSYLDLRHDAQKWRLGRVKLAAWNNEFQAQDFMKSTAP